MAATSLRLKELPSRVSKELIQVPEFTIVRVTAETNEVEQIEDSWISVIPW